MMADRLQEYFADEAGDYLDQLHRLLNEPSRPDTGEFLRLAVGVRGSTRMAGAEPISGLTERLEDVARSVAEHRLEWSDELPRAARDTVSEIQALLSAVPHWGPSEDERVQRCLRIWGEVDDRAVADDRPVVPIDTLFYDERPVVPIDSLFYDDSPVVPIDALFYDDSGPHILGVDATAADEVAPAVPIDTLLLRGEAALREALSLRPAFETFARGDALPDQPLSDLVDELFDLLNLSLTPEIPEV